MPTEARAALREAMLADVLDACEAVGGVYLVTLPRPLRTGATLVADRGGGQGAAVAAGLEAAAAAGATAPFLVVNADLPCATARDLLDLAGAIPDGGLALVPAADGTTNALALSSSRLFAPCYGPGSAARFAALAPSRVLDLANLVDDVDTADDLERLRDRLGPKTRRALGRLRAGAAA
jgi:2-phospho-L-lactate guanylyltransferase (CobY/MobA/RfbA family)